MSSCSKELGPNNALFDLLSACRTIAFLCNGSPLYLYEVIRFIVQSYRKFATCKQYDDRACHRLDLIGVGISFQLLERVKTSPDFTGQNTLYKNSLVGKHVGRIYCNRHREDIKQNIKHDVLKWANYKFIAKWIAGEVQCFQKAVPITPYVWIKNSLHER